MSGTALAAETQLGADNASGRHGRPGASTVSPVDVPAPAGEQARGVLVSFTVSDRSASVPVQVESVWLGHDRIEASMQALAIGGQIPSDVLDGPLTVFEQRVATEGRSTEA